MKKVKFTNIQIERKVQFYFCHSLKPLWQGLLLCESCILIVGSRNYDADQELEEKRYVEDTIKEVKSYNKGALKPTSTLANLLHSFDLDPADPLPAIKKWVGEKFNGANWNKHQVCQNKYCTHPSILLRQ